MGVFYFPTNFVYWRQVPEHHIFKEKILKFIKEHPNHLRSNGLIKGGKTSFKNRDVEGFFRGYKEFMKSVIWDTLDEAIREIDSRENTPETKIKSSFLYQCWCTTYTKDSIISFHNHQTVGREILTFDDDKKMLQSFSMLYIINDESDTNYTEFIQPFSSAVSSHAETTHVFDTSKYKDVGEGTVLVFPSNLYHQVLSMTKPNRVIFSCDIVSDFHGD